MTSPPDVGWLTAHRQLFVGIARKIIRRLDTAEALVHTVYLKVMAHGGLRVGNPTQAVAYVTAALRRQHCTERLRPERARERDRYCSTPEVVPARRDDWGAEVPLGLIESLPPDERDAPKLAHHHDMPIRAIAWAQSVSSRTALRRLSTARVSLGATRPRQGPPAPRSPSRCAA
jgi:DNA-directed RNA polymerase specialized sigma24 family protein